jgi:predicted dehydrogenase
MGNQGTAESTLRKSAALIQAGAIGTPKEVHIWTNRPVWPQGLDRPTDEQPVPSHIHWPEWIGPAKFRLYHPAYHPFKWRGWWAFGTGALGDMACHTLNMAFMALDLRDPISVQAETSGHNKETYPKWSVITFEFPARGKRPAVKMVWYDGGKLPPKELLPGREVTSSGALVIGDKGSLTSPGDYGGDNDGSGIIFPDGSFVQQDKVKQPAVEFERSPGHFTEWALAIKMGKQARSNFPDYSGPLTETVLLGNLSVWAAAEPGVGRKIDWDAQKLEAKNGDAEIAEIVKHTYHNGYSLDDLA